MIRLEIQASDDVDNILASPSSRKVDHAMALVGEDAPTENLVRAENYYGAWEIRNMLTGMLREGRRFDLGKVDGDRNRITEKKSDGDLCSIALGT